MSNAAHRLEMSHSVANDAIRGVEMQHYRVVTALPEDERFFAGFGFRREVDLQLLLVLVARFRRAVGLGASLLEETTLNAALADFDGRIPVARRMRNVSEHIDEYIGIPGSERRDVRADSLGVRLWADSPKGDMAFIWAGMKIGLGDLRQAVRDLYSAFRAAIEGATGS